MRNDFRLSAPELRRTLGSWIAGGDWRWFVRLTLHDPVSDVAAWRKFRRFEEKLNLQFFGRSWRKPGRPSAKWVCVAERFRGNPKFHLLIGPLGECGAVGQVWKALSADWVSGGGDCDFEEVRSPDTLARYVARDYGWGAELEFSAGLHAGDLAARTARC